MCSYWVSLSQVCALAACTPLGSVCLQWIWWPLCYGQDEMAHHLHPILWTWDAVTISGVARSLVLAVHLLSHCANNTTALMCFAQDRIAWHEQDKHRCFGRARAHLGPAFATPLVTTCTPVIFFPLEVRLCSEKKCQSKLIFKVPATT